MGSAMSFFSGQTSKEDLEAALKKAKEIVASNSVVVFSKTHCPFCRRAKELLTQLGASYKAIELDMESDGRPIQDGLAEWTGQRTVPNVFIGGKHIGGCDTLVQMNQEDKLLPLLVDAGAVANPSSQS